MLNHLKPIVYRHFGKLLHPKNAPFFPFLSTSWPPHLGQAPDCTFASMSATFVLICFICSFLTSFSTIFSLWIFSTFTSRNPAFVIFCLYNKNTIYRNHYMINLCCPTASTKHHIIQYSILRLW